jgi:hypothetical protein
METLANGDEKLIQIGDWLDELLDEAGSNVLELPPIGVRFRQRFGGLSKEVLGVQLQVFVRNHLSDRFVVCYWHDNDSRLAICRVGVDPGPSWTVTPAGGDAPRPEVKLTYDPNFWKAFHRTWAGESDDARRVVSVRAPFEVRNIGAEDDVPTGFIEIGRKYLTGPSEGMSMPELVALTHASIRRWLGDNGLDASQFAPGHSLALSPVRKPVPRHEIVLRKSGDVFDRLSKLSSADKGRIFIPLDIVEKLFD